MVTTSKKTGKSRSTYHHGNLRQALLDAAEVELENNGVEKFSLRRVATRAGVSHGAPAHHFEDARDLLTALVARGYERFIAAQERRERAVDDQDDSPETKLVASGLGYLDFATSNPALFRLMFSSERPDRSNPLLVAAADAAFDKLVDHIEAIKARDPRQNQAAMADVLASWAMAHGLADLLIADRLKRATFLASMSKSERDGFFSTIILRAIATGTTAIDGQ